ncbi:MAG: heparinase II/III family protein [Hyphomicrobiaceae bacterium]
MRRPPSFGERVVATRAAMKGAVGRASAAVSLSPLFRWRYGPAAADSLLIQPHDLRSPDPIFAAELLRGEIGLAGRAIGYTLDRLFTERPECAAWWTELHGFGWLRHVTAAEDAEASQLAVAIVDQWIRRVFAQRDHSAWEPGVTARRTLAWLAHAGLLYEDAAPEAYDRFAQALGAQIVQLAATWATGRDGTDRLLAVIARVAADVCVKGREPHLSQSLGDLARELDRQIDVDGAHVSRNPDATVEVLLDLLPVQHCVWARDIELPPAIDAAVTRMMKMIRYLRMEPDGLGRFHGGGRIGLEHVAAVLGYDPQPDQTYESGPRGGYIRLARGPLTLLIDAAGPPPLSFAGHAHAGCLAFELAIGDQLVIANAGAPQAGVAGSGPQARATAAHSTLVLADCSSASLLAASALERVAGGPPLVMSGRVTWAVSSTDAAEVVEAGHEGYLETFGLVHRRRIDLRADGSEVHGIDRLHGANAATVRLKKDLPFAVRFHLGPEVIATASTQIDTVDLRLLGGEVWSFSVTGVHLSLEESVRHDPVVGPMMGGQLVLRGATFGDSVVEWRLVRRA